MDNDDLPVGRVLSRREVLALFGLAGAAVLAGCSLSGSDSEPTVSSTTQTGKAGSATTPALAASAAVTSGSATPESGVAPKETASLNASNPTQPVNLSAALGTLPACIVSPELTEGPYFVDEGLNRSDVRSDPATGAVSEGTLLQLVLRLLQVNGGGCAPLAGASVDIWHCDAFGVYSDVSDPGFSTVGQQFLRGYQVTDASGLVQFTTVYPGWYPGRAVHIHFKIRGKDASGGNYEFTSQFFSDESVTDQAHALEPYASQGYRTLLNDGDGIYQDGGDQLMLTVTEAQGGYLGTFDIGVQLG